jgi:hypothetical protein
MGIFNMSEDQTSRSIQLEDGVAITTGSISTGSDGSGNVPEGGAGKGVFADKVGKVKKRKRPRILTFDDYVKNILDGLR